MKVQIQCHGYKRDDNHPRWHLRSRSLYVTKNAFEWSVILLNKVAQTKKYSTAVQLFCQR